LLLDFTTPVHERFAQNHSVPGYHPPAGTPRPGEESVRQTFGEEWGAVASSELSFTYSHEDLVALNRRVWLRRAAEEQLGSVLDAGCGLGRETLALREVTGAELVVGVDLNSALAESREAADPPPGVHFVVASLFALPFPDASFDLVYAQGVLHHTHSTQNALRAVARHVREGGYLFVWLYALEDRLVERRLRRRAATAAEAVVRPLVARSTPRARRTFFRLARAVAHPRLRSRMRHGERWQPMDTEAFLRDWLSPRYAHRHGWNEVIEWLEELGFAVVDLHSPLAYRRLFAQRLFGIGLTARRRNPQRAANS
jgi:SAM-dependent methyltransferase